MNIKELQELSVKELGISFKELITTEDNKIGQNCTLTIDFENNSEVERKFNDECLKGTFSYANFNLLSEVYDGVNAREGYVLDDGKRLFVLEGDLEEILLQSNGKSLVEFAKKNSTVLVAKINGLHDECDSDIDLTIDSNGMYLLEGAISGKLKDLIEVAVYNFQILESNIDFVVSE
ncbi:hypothetical protein RI065_06375 [Mycoplasmatota bacterium zrk1]